MEAAFIEFPLIKVEEVDLSGYGFSRGRTTEVLDMPVCSMVLMKNDDKRFLLISLDTVSVSKEFTDMLKEALEIYGFVPEKVAICAVHTHSGPGITCFPDDYEEEKSSIRNYRLALSLKDTICQMAVELEKQTEKVSSFMSVVPISGGYGNRNLPDGEYESNIYLLKLVRENESTLAFIANMSCHSTILKADNRKLSADLAGAVRNELAQIYGTSVMMTIGAAGDVSSRFQVERHDYSSVIQTGQTIASQAKEAVFHPVNLSDARIEQIQLVYRYDPKTDIKLKSRMNVIRDTPLAFMIPTLERRAVHSIFEINTTAYIMKMKDLNIIFFPGELVTSFGKKLKEVCETPTIICCYANDYWQYFVPEEEYGLYFETFNSICPKGVADRFVADIIQRLRS